MIQPNELAFYQADAKDPWSYLWVGFAGSRAEEYLHSMGLSDRHPIFHVINQRNCIPLSGI